MQLIDIMDDFDMVISDLEEEKFTDDVSQYINKLRDISSELLDFYREHKSLLRLSGKRYDTN